jgi:hypothetical protein
MSMKWSGACSALSSGSAEVRDFVDGFRGAEESGYVGGQRLGGETVDHDVALAAPAEGRRDGEQRQKDEREMRAEMRFHCWP